MRAVALFGARVPTRARPRSRAALAPRRPSLWQSLYNVSDDDDDGGGDGGAKRARRAHDMPPGDGAAAHREMHTTIARSGDDHQGVAAAAAAGPTRGSGDPPEVCEAPATAPDLQGAVGPAGAARGAGTAAGAVADAIGAGAGAHDGAITAAGTRIAVGQAIPSWRAAMRHNPRCAVPAPPIAVARAPAADAPADAESSDSDVEAMITAAEVAAAIADADAEAAGAAAAPWTAAEAMDDGGSVGTGPMIYEVDSVVITATEFGEDSELDDALAAASPGRPRAAAAGWRGFPAVPGGSPHGTRQARVTAAARRATSGPGGAGGGSAGQAVGGTAGAGFVRHALLRGATVVRAYDGAGAEGRRGGGGGGARSRGRDGARWVNA